jgi:hypothetical protein
MRLPARWERLTRRMNRPGDSGGKYVRITSRRWRREPDPVAARVFSDRPRLTHTSRDAPDIFVSKQVKGSLWIPVHAQNAGE